MNIEVIAIRSTDRVLLIFLREQGNEFALTYSHIIRSTGISQSTVQRAMNRLECAGFISRKRGVGRSYIYKVHPHDHR